MAWPMISAALPAQAGALRDRVFGWRDRLLASTRFQRWAATFPFARGIAHRRTRALFDLCAGFVYAQVLSACVELKLFDILKQGPCRDADLARRMGLAPDATRRLLRAAQSLRLIEERGAGRRGLGPLGAVLAGSPAIVAMVRHHRLLYDDLRDPVALLRGEHEHTALSRFWPYATQPEQAGVDQVAPYSALMAASLPMLVDDVLEAYPLDRHDCLLDVGGGLGAFVSAIANRVPRLRLMLFDLPSVAESARRSLARDSLDRIAVHGGSFREQPLPRGADIITLVRVVHDHEDAAVRSLLSAAWQALPPGGTLLIAEPMAESDASDPISDAYFGLYLAAMGSGRARTPDEIEELLRDAGFTDIRLRRTRRPLLIRVITAHKAKV